ncbi:Hypothetical Protein FCC1311_067472 [Hondaea fermentalgiana]|uniref:Uncharacterized protein n=1 Tax=Hondaea fermentalgiana TaxID=2315210 RepID=A0A2R5GI08_9STRA|nr:Hypothetical Protein FCC1311_067472 [Hondaea fermentalgiana]|eukprot:GBG30527.1 Hypothetical Protein FCC1311_067472 [Hondaea fermentalgiana]
MERNFANKLEAARGRAAAHDAALREQLRKADATFAATTRHQRWRLRQTREVFETRQAGPDMVIASRNPQMYLDAYNTQTPVVLDLADGRRVSGKVTDVHWHGPEKGGSLHLRGDALPYARHQAIAYEIETRVESIRAMNEQFRACLQASDSNDCPIDEDDADQRATNALKGVADAKLYGALCKRYSGFPDEFFVQLERPGRAFLRLVHFQAARIANWLRFWYTHRIYDMEKGNATQLQTSARGRENAPAEACAGLERLAAGRIRRGAESVWLSTLGVDSEREFTSSAGSKRQ